MLDGPNAPRYSEIKMTDAINFPAPDGTIHLQSVGLQPAIKTEHIVPGVVLVWNFGETSRVVSVEPVSACFVSLVIVDAKGQEWTRRAKIGRKFGYSPKLSAAGEL